MPIISLPYEHKSTMMILGKKQTVCYVQSLQQNGVTLIAKTFSHIYTEEEKYLQHIVVKGEQSYEKENKDFIYNRIIRIQYDVCRANSCREYG